MKSASESGVPGTRPEGVRDEREAAAHVREMFGRIAPRYDLLNHLLSLDIDKIWRRRVAKRFSAILHNPAARVLDLCCGTGDQAFAFRKEAPIGAEIMGSDFVPEMLVRARAKAAAFGAGVTFVEADALSLPFGGGSFDLVSCSFGFRNLANYERGLLEIFRVLKPGGVYVYDTINRTFLSRVIVIKLFQEWRWSSIMPPRLHVWAMFIKPSELARMLRDAGLEIVDVSGLVYDPARGTWSIGRDVGVNYMIAACKPA